MQRMPYTTVLIGMSLAWGVMTAGVARAEPPQYCRDLALQFGSAPDQMDANALATLGACVMSEFQQRSGTPGQPAPAVQQQESPGNTPIDQPGWGEWPAPAPWSDEKAKTQSWGTQ